LVGRPEKEAAVRRLPSATAKGRVLRFPLDDDRHTGLSMLVGGIVEAPTSRRNLASLSGCARFSVPGCWYHAARRLPYRHAILRLFAAVNDSPVE